MPEAAPVTTPEASIVAAVALLLLQTPPETALFNVSVEPTQTPEPPEIGEEGATVTVVATAQPAPIV